jgi:LPXTG-site transpeptidase (sortase) family protein
MKRNRKKFIYVGVIAVVGFLGFTLSRSVLYAPVDEIAPPEKLQEIAEAQALSPKHPVRLTIPSLDIDAKITDVGITRNGTMATPRKFSDVGWYKYGPMPGDKGSAVIAGHVDNGLALPAVFKPLENIKIGDDIYVETVEGTQVHFIVTNLATYDFNAPAHAVFNQNNGTFLKLITCSGVWLSEEKTHDKRLVVTAVLK